MASAFKINQHDLEFMLRQIRIGEFDAGGMTTVEAIQAEYNISAFEAALVPFGIRTVDGSDNSLLPGQELFGAADQLFPRLLDPSYGNEQDEAPFANGAVGANTDYSVGGNVIDSDPRIISNLISDQTVANPAAIIAALKSIGIEGSEANSAQAAITAAYRATLNANGFDFAVTQAQATLDAANTAEAQAIAANQLVVARHAAFVAAQGLSNEATVSAAAVPAALQALAVAIAALELPEEAVKAAEVSLASLVADQSVANNLLTVANDALTAATLTGDADAILIASGAVGTASANFNNATAAVAAQQTVLDLAEDALASVQVVANDAFGAAIAAALLAGTDAVAVLAALNPPNPDHDFVTPEAQAAGNEAEALVTALNTIGLDLVSFADAGPLVLATDAFDAGAAAASEATFPALVSSAAAALAPAAQAVADTGAAQDSAQATFDAVSALAATTGTPEATAAALAQLLDEYGLEVGADNALFIRNLSPDVGLTQSINTITTIFGQFFDHGLDLLTKGGNGTVYIPLMDDDPIVAGDDGLFGTGDDLPAQLRFMALTRATPTDVNGVDQHKNLTTPFVDQNQTYTSHASHQVFLREYVRLDIDGNGEKTYATGRLLDGTTASGSINGAPANWAETKANALEFLGIKLSDFDVHDVPLLATDPYGNLILGDKGYAQLATTGGLVQGTAEGVTTENAIRTGHPFLADIAHHAVPGQYDSDGDRRPDTNQRPDEDAGVGDDLDSTTYDDEMLNSHFITGDGRGNENIALTSIHAVFHSEHNRVLEANKQTILDSGDIDFINEWLLVDLAPGASIPTDVNAVTWDGARMFQAARFSTEMQYQHMVFEEFARRIQPGIDPFVFTNSPDVNPAIFAEFAHAVYRFGHSMLNSSVDRLDNDLNFVNGDTEQVGLIEAFLSPQEYMAGGADLDAVQGALFRGMEKDVGNAIDEFVVDALRSNLLGLPLDLPALNIARARETGTPTLQEARQQLYNDFGLADLKPYTGWNDFVQNIKTPLSVINFIAAYGTHAAITSATTLQEKRDAATLLVLGDGSANGSDTQIGDITVLAGDRAAFLNGSGAYASDNGGLDKVDLWIGGLAEKAPEFGGMLGTTFNFVFEAQLENLQNADRFYYLSRTQGLNILNQLEPNTFADIVMRNSDLSDDYATHLSGQLFLTPDYTLELDRAIAQEDYNVGGAGRDPEHEDPILQAIDPKVVRVDSGVTDGNGHQVGGELRFRGGEHVVLGGTEGDDILVGDIGDDTLWGDGGDDYLNGGQGADQVFGGEGDDIIEDPFGDNFLRGEGGNDVISASRGVNLLFGGEGTDVLLLGQDASEVFGDEGDDFILGSSGADFLLGGEGDDWIEGGEGFDTIAGDNSELFFNSTIIGHDVAWGQGNDQDYDLESGDDIAFTGPGVQRHEGMFGFDWSIGKYDVAGLDLDTERKPIPPEDDILRDRFDLMEGISGWRFDDIIRGDSRGGAVAEADPLLDFGDHLLTQEGIERIEGFAEWFANARATLFGSNAAAFRDGNIFLGGDGNDTFEGRGGFDMIDGDAWLNVRIRVMVDGVEYSAESLNSAANVAGPNAGKLFALDANGRPDFAAGPAFEGRALTALLLDRTVKPGDMKIVREIRYDTTPGNNIDTAIFRGIASEYAIEGRGHETPGQLWNSFDLNGDGFISVTHLNPLTDALADDTDLLKNIEQARFLDETVTISGFTPVLINLEANLTFTGVPPVLNARPGAGVLIGTLTSSVADVTFEKVSGANIAISPDGEVTMTGNLISTVLNIEVSNVEGSSAERMVILAGTNGANTLIGDATDDNIIYAFADVDTLTGGAGDDTLYGQAGADTLNGGDGNDTLVGGRQGDIIDGGAGDDLILHAWGDGFDTIDGGADFDTVRITGNAANQNLSVVYTGGAIASIGNIGSFANIEAIHADMGGSADRLSYTPTSDAVTVNLVTGAASGFASIANIRDVSGTSNGDTVRTNTEENQIRTGNGGDMIIVTVDDVADLLHGGGGIDTVDYSAHTSNLSVVLQGTTSIVNGSGAAPDTLQAIENFIAGSGDDTISGTTGANTLVGGVGADTIFGGRGADTLTGGADADTFVFTANNQSTVANSDLIAGFVPGEDVIDLGTYLVGLRVVGQFAFKGTDAFNTGNEDQVRYVQVGGNTLVQIDTDNDTSAEAQIELAGLHTLTAFDFIL